MPVGGNIAVCSSFGTLADIPICGDDTGCNGESALQHTSGAVSTNCSASMVDQDRCAAVCSGDVRVQGTIKCMSGRLVDASHCISDMSLMRKDVLKLFGTVDLAFTGSPTSASLTKAVSDAFGVGQEYVAVYSEAFPTSAGRLLSAIQRVPPVRFLDAVETIKFQYTVVVDPNATQNVTTQNVFSDAMALSDLNSTVGHVFAQSLLTSGVIVKSVSYHYDPVVVKSLILTDASGEVAKFDVSQKQTTPTTPPENDDWSIGTIILIVAGSLLGLAMFVGIAQYLILMRRKAEA